MITADEARNIARQKELVERIINYISFQIKHNAEQGLNFVDFVIDSSMPEPVIELVINELESNGYQVSRFSKEECFVPHLYIRWGLY